MDRKGLNAQSNCPNWVNGVSKHTSPASLLTPHPRYYDGGFCISANHPKGENALVATACIEAMGCPLKYLIRQRLTTNSEKGKGWESYWLANGGLSPGFIPVP